MSRKQATSKQQATSSTGPFLVRRAEGVPKSRKNVTTLSGDVFRNFLGDNFFSVGPPPDGNGDLVIFWPVLGRRPQARNSGTGPKTGKRKFPGARGPEIEEKKVTTLSGMVVRNFFTLCILPDVTPRGGKSQNTGILGHWPLALR